MRGMMGGLFRRMPLRYFLLTAVASWTTAVGLLYSVVWTNEQIRIVEPARHVARVIFFRDARITMLLPRLAASNTDSLLNNEGLFAMSVIIPITGTGEGDAVASRQRGSFPVPSG